MFIKALFIIAKREKLQVHWWMDKQNVIYPNKEIVLSLKKEGLSDICDDMNFENTVLSEISQSQKDKYYIT